MAKYIAAEKSEVWFVPALSSTTAPTATQLNLGTRLTAFMSGGFAADFSGNLVDSGDLTSAFNTTVAGTYGGGLNTISGIHRDNSADTAWNALARGTAGYFVTQAGVTTGATWASGDIVDGIFPATVVSRHYPDLTRDALVTFDVDYAITAVPTFGGNRRHIMDAAGLLASKTLRTTNLTLDTGDDLVTLTLSALPRKQYRELIENHPPGEKDKDGAEWNGDTFPAALMQACIQDPPFTLEEAQTLWDDWEASEVGRVFLACWNLNENPAGLAFISPGSARTSGSGRNSTTASPKESPTPSSSNGAKTTKTRR